MDQSDENTKPSAENTNPVKVRGSGFSYDEEKKHTDESVPLKKAEGEDIVELPDLGNPNRP